MSISPSTHMAVRIQPLCVTATTESQDRASSRNEAILSSSCWRVSPPGGVKVGSRTPSPLINAAGHRRRTSSFGLPSQAPKHRSLSRPSTRAVEPGKSRLAVIVARCNGDVISGCGSFDRAIPLSRHHCSQRGGACHPINISPLFSAVGACLQSVSLVLNLGGPLLAPGESTARSLRPAHALHQSWAAAG